MQALTISVRLLYFFGYERKSYFSERDQGVAANLTGNFASVLEFRRKIFLPWLTVGLKYYVAETRVDYEKE